MSTGVQPGDGYSVNTLNGVSSLSVNKPYISDNNPGILVGVVLPDPPIFPDINGPEFPDFESLDKVLQFEVQTVIVGDNQYVRIASGAVNFTVSNMPEIYKGMAHDVRQAWIHAVAVRPGITVVNGGDSSSPWMEDGGYYVMPASGTYYVTISKMDIGDASTSSLLQQKVPFVSIFSSEDALYEKIFSETGPSQYINTTNVQKMEGYDAASTGLTGDFGNCHTTWFLPVKWGYACKIIAVIEATTPTITAPTVSVVHAATATSNEVHRVTLPPDVKKSGSFQLQYAPGFTSDTTDPFDPFNPLNSGNLTGQFQWNLANALKAIQSLRGNSSVTVQGENKLDITYIGELANTAVALPAIINNTVGAPAATYDVFQNVVGSIDMTSHPQFLGTTLMNVPNWVESEDDPYNEYEANDWNDISNYLQKDALETISPSELDYYILMLSPNDWTSANYSWTKVDGCSAEACAHPFFVKRQTSGETVTFTVCTGMVNNIVPSNMDVVISLGAAYVYISCTVSGSNYPVDVTIGSGASIPADTDSNSYIAIAQISGEDSEQLVSSSLWTERFKCGMEPAKYWWSNV